MANRAKRAGLTAGERVAMNFVGPHPSLARRIDAAIRRAVKAEHHRMNVIAWNLYQKAHDFSPDQANEILSAITPTPAAHQTGKVKRTNKKGGSK